MTTLSENKDRDHIYSEYGKKWEKILFVFNPVSGKSQIRGDLMDILETLSQKTDQLVCYPTQCQGDARRLLRSCREDYDCVICAGGDGTLDEVVSGVMENSHRGDVPIGFISAGTTNDFATSLGIPGDMKAAARAVTEGKIFECDLGKFNSDSYFTYVAAFGLFTGTSYETPQDLKNQFGHLAYIIQGMTDIGKIRIYRFRVESAELSVTDDFVFGMVTNSKSVGGFPDITGEAVDMGDGLFEVTLIKMPSNILELNDIIQYLNHTSNASDFVYQFKTRHIVLEAQERVKWTRDGEYAGSYKKVELTNLHRALRLLVPEQK